MADIIKSNLRVKSGTVSSASSHTFTVPSSSTHLFIVVGGDARLWMGIINAKANGAVNYAEAAKGTAATASSTTNSFTMTWSTSGQFIWTDICLSGTPMTA